MLKVVIIVWFTYASIKNETLTTLGYISVSDWLTITWRMFEWDLSWRKQTLRLEFLLKKRDITATNQFKLHNHPCDYLYVSDWYLNSLLNSVFLRRISRPCTRSSTLIRLSNYAEQTNSRYIRDKRKKDGLYKLGFLR